MSQSNDIATGIVKAVLFLVFIYILTLFISGISSVITYILLSFVMTLMASPVISFLKTRLKVPNTLSVILTQMMYIGFIVLLFFIFKPLLEQQTQSLALLDVGQIEVKLNTSINNLDVFFKSHGINFSISQLKDTFLSGLNLDFIPSILNNTIGILGNMTMGLFSVLFMSFFFMKDGNLFTKVIQGAVSDKHEGKFLNAFEEIKRLLSRYFLGLFFQVFVMFSLYSILLLVCGIPNAFTIAFMCALLNLIPYIGPLFGGAIMAVLSMTYDLNLDFATEILPTTSWVMSGYFICQLIDNFVNQPIIFSKSAKSHPLEIFIVILIGGNLFGILGMVLAIPSYTVLKVIAKEFASEFKFVQSITKDL